jgi:hypothetical protein
VGDHEQVIPSTPIAGALGVRPDRIDCREWPTPETNAAASLARFELAQVGRQTRVTLGFEGWLVE